MYDECETFWLLFVFVIFFLYAKMQDSTNFETIITTWRRLSGELQSEPTFASMSGDSDRHHKKKEEEAALLISDKSKAPAANVATAGAVAAEAALSETVASTSPTDKQESFIQHDKGDSKDATGDSNDNDYLENNGNDKKPDFKTEDKATEWDKDKLGDKVDSVYLRPPPPHKARSTASTANDDEDCGIKCLYYTLQCCDCVLM